MLVASSLLAVPVIARAQEAVISGTVTDSTGGVLPGVTVTAVHTDTGNKFVAITDERGVYRLAARSGVYVLTAELQGFRAVTRENLQLLIGQNMTVNLPMLEATATETITVTAESPLLNVATSQLGGNVDPRQVQELPVNGRNWVSLALLAPGSRANPSASGVAALTPLPDRNNGEAREFQLNMDGQQVSADIGTGGQPRYSQDSIAEFQFISNRFDATQGRSSGVQVNAITKSGTNRISALFRANFRNAKFNAENPVLNRVEPINNQQWSGTFGGPFVQDKLHYFANFEYEREPRTSIWNTPYPEFNAELEGTNNKKLGGVRVDYQLSTQTRLLGKVSAGRLWEPFGLGNQQHPAATNTTSEHNNEAIGQLTQVLSNRALNEVKVGYAFFNLANANLTTWSNHWQKDNGITTGSPRITFTGFQIAGNQFHPRHQDQDVWSFRDDFSFSYDWRGRHDLRTGGEFLRRHQIQANCRQCMGTVAANARGPRPGEPGSLVPTPLPVLFPDAFNADTWNLAAISPLVTTYSVGLGDFDVHMVSQKVAAWAQDDWQISNKLTLNLGLRWDAALNAFANDIAVPPFQQAGRPNEIDNIQPRLGFAWQLTERTVIRGGTGLYYGDALGADQSFATGNAQIVVINYANDGRADFAANPTNGQPLPTYEQALRRFCYLSNPGVLGTNCLIRDLQEFVGPVEYVNLPRTFQASIGVQRQIGDAIAVEADYVYSKGRDEKDVVENINLSFNPATGTNYPFSNRAMRPYPDWGVVSMNTHLARSEYHALQTGLTKRFRNRWQGSAIYTLSGLWNADTKPFSGLEPVPFFTVPDLGGEWGLSADDQRHRGVFTGIWQVGRGFQFSALHYFLAGIRLSGSYGGDLRGTGAANSARLRPDGTVVPRNALIAPSQNRTDIRLQQRFPLLGRLSIDGIAEVFNLFNQTNFGIGTVESNRTQYLQPVTGQFRSMQFGFRLTY
jgi:hypothetical protein